ncbi:MAG TPA: heparin lyase I family protein [Burkholderiales bacterium]|nr:heparin lyase I family protein [Burkholderiales bacterium]
MFRILRSAVLILLFCFSATALPETVTLINDLGGTYTGTTDARIGIHNPNLNFGGGTTMLLADDETQRSLFVRFAIFAAEGGPVPDNASITSATLSLYKFAGPAAVIKASRVKRAWNEMEVTWNVAATGAPWQTAGALGANDVEASADGQGSAGDAAVDGCTGTPPPASCWLHINVTSGVQAFRSGAPNHGWKLSYVSGGVASVNKEFYASERDSGVASLRPTLAITYTMEPDDCSRPGLNLCARFEPAPETQFSPGGQTSVMRTLGVGGAATDWTAHNKGGDNASDTTRIALVDGSRDPGGSKAIKFTTKHDDSGVHGSGDWERSEVKLSTADSEAGPNDENWWAHSVYFPPEFQHTTANHNASVFFQFHKTNEDIGSQPNFSLNVYNEPLVPGVQGSRQVIRAITHGGSGTFWQYEYQAENGLVLKGACLDLLQEGVWYDFVHRIRWSYTGSGIHEIWMRRAGGPVRKVLQATGINTLFTNDVGAYLKFGTYHDFVAGDSSVIHDRLRRGSSYQAVKPTDFPATPPAFPGTPTTNSCPAP